MAYDIWEAQRRSFDFAERWFTPVQPPEPEESPEEEEPEPSFRITCRNTFRITRPECRACSGQKTSCPEYEPWRLKI